MSNNLFNCWKAKLKGMLISSEAQIRKKMKEWNGYFIDKEGIIYNKDGSIKSLKKNTKGYLFTNFSYGGRVHCHLAHTVVAQAWLGPKPDKYEVDHKNNVRDDNRVANLQYLSKSENNKKSYISGNRDISGDKNPNSIFRRLIRERSETIEKQLC